MSIILNREKSKKIIKEKKMDNKDNFWQESKDDNNQFEENSFEEKNTEEKAIATPETYYHNINTPNEGKEDRYYEVFDQNKPKTMGWSLASMILGIVSVVCCCLGWAGLIMGVAAIVFAAVSRCSLKYFDAMSIAGLILGIFGVVFGSVMLLATIFMAMPEFEVYFDNFMVNKK